MSGENQKTILLVDDEVIIAMTEKMTLEKFGYNVITAHTGEEAVAAVEKTPAIDLILMDINLGAGIDGTEAAAIILRQRDLPVVFLSSHTEPEVVEKTEKITSYGYVVKNSSSTVLDASIKMAFKLFEAKIKEQEKESPREAALEALRESEERFRTLYENSTIGIYRTTPEGRIHLANPALVRMLGYLSFDDLSTLNLEKNGFDSSYPRTQFVEIIEKDGEVKGLESAWTRKDGTIIFVRESARAIRDSQAKTLYYDGIVEDITERKRAEEAFLREKAFLDQLVESAPEAIVFGENDGRILRINSEFCRLFGYKEKEVLGKNIDDLISSAEKKSEALSVTQTVGKGKKFSLETVRRRKNDKPINVSLIGSPIIIDGQQVATYGIYRDISDRKQAETIQHIQYKIANAMIKAETLSGLLKTVRKELSSLIDTTNFVVAIYDETSGLLSASFKRDKKDAIPQWRAEKSLTGLVIQQKRSMLLSREQILQMFQAGTIKLIGTTAEAWLGVPLQINEKVLGAIVVQSYDNVDAYDQSSVNIMEMIASQLSVYIERERAEEALRESEERYRTLVENASDIVFRTDKNGCFTFVNPVGLRIAGYKEVEIIGKHYSGLIHSGMRDQAIKHFGRQFVKGIQNTYLEYPLLTKDGHNIWLGQNTQLIVEDGHVTGFQAVARDITERKRAEEEIKRQLSEKETLLKEVHHRIKNNIASIGGLLSLHAQSVTNPEAIAVLQDAIGRVNSMSILYDKLLLSENYKDISVKNYVESLADLVVALFPDNAKIKLDKRIADFHLDAKQLFPLGIIINELLTNITKYAFINRDIGLIKISLTNVANHVTLSIQDNGTGLPDGFDINESKGFGLKLVNMLCQQLGGSFSIKKHAGTRCKIEFNI